MLQATRSPARIPDEVDFFDSPNSSSRGVDSASNRNEYQESSWGYKKRPARRADNLAVIYEPNVRKCGSLNLSQP
jgi:hypothetical protein